MIPRIYSNASRRVVGRIHIRQYAASSSQASPSSKISVVPFRQTPQSAMDRLHAFALFASARPSNFAAAALRFSLGSFGTLIAETLGLGSKVSLKQMKAVYYPIWRTDVMLEGEVWQTGDKKKTKTTGLIATRGAYVPGNSYAPLSYISFAVPPIEEGLEAYDPARDLHQLGDGFEVVPVPFTASPIGLLKNLKKRLGSKAEIDDLTFDLTTWRAALVACYPIMFPLYIADFEYEAADGSIRTLNTVMDAHDENIGSCRISCPPVPEVRDRNPAFARNYWINPAPFAPETELLVPFPDFPPGFFDEAAEEEEEKPKGRRIQIGFVSVPERKLPSALDEWMSPAPTSDSSVPPSPMYEVEQEEGGVNWDDARIQSWSGSELPQNEAYYAAACDYRARAAMRKRCETWKALPNPDADMAVSATGSDFKSGKAMVDEMVEQTRKAEADARKMYWEAKPAWLKKYEAALVQKEKEGESKVE